MGLLADEVRGKGINEALTYLAVLSKKAYCRMFFIRLLKSAAANADQKGTIDVDTLFVKTILVGQGTTLKRFRPRAKGSAFRINKKTSHVSVTLAER